MTKNRRFPFERTKEKISLEDFSTTNTQLYPVIRQYISSSRYNTTTTNNNNNNSEKYQYLQQEIVSNQENYQLNELIKYLKQEHNNNIVDINNLSNLREYHIQHWKHVKNLWQKYYHDQIKKQQEIFDNLIKPSSHK